MAELKTKLNDSDVIAFLNSVEHPKRKEDAFAVLEIMNRVTGEKPKMWGSKIVGYGLYDYQYASGQSGQWFKVGFSPRKQNMSLYFMSGFGVIREWLPKLGKHKTGKSCLYINKMEDIDTKVLEQMIKQTLEKLENL